MEDDVGLELSLGLACGRRSSTSSSKDTSEISVDGSKVDTDERTNKILNDFRNFLNAGVPQSIQTRNPENFCLRPAVSRGNDSVNETGACDRKRKSVFVGTDNKNKRHEAESYGSVVQGMGKNSQVSITTDEGSIEDNEDESSSASAPSTPVYSSAAQGFPLANSGQRVTRVASQWGVARSRLLHAPYDLLPRYAALKPATNFSSAKPTQPENAVSEDGARKRSSFSSGYPDIRPGIATGLNIAGSGSIPNLPWVSTTGSGPNGKVISGVTYQYAANQIRIVCACHGLHLSPEEFLRHASSDDQAGALPDAGNKLIVCDRNPGEPSE